MKNRFRIFFLSTEVAPFVAQGYLAQQSSELPKALKDMGHDIRVMMPNYKFVNERKYVLRDVIRLKDMSIGLNGREVKVSAKSAFLPNSKVQIYFLDHKGYFGRDGLYADPKTGKAYPDNPERFVAFCQGCVETLRMLHWQPDIIHCNGWPTVLLPLYLKKCLADDEFFKNTRFVCTVGSFVSQESLPIEALKESGLTVNGNIAIDGKMSILKAAAEYCDTLIAPSTKFIEETLGNGGQGQGLIDFLKKHKKKFVAIPSGVDFKEWDPENDQHLIEGFTTKTLGRKEANKRALLETLHLPFNANRPLLAIPVAELKPEILESILGAPNELLSLDVQIVFVGEPAAGLKSKLAKLAARSKDQIAVLPAPEEALAHLVIAGADMLLLPDVAGMSETVHLCAMRYGTIPIVGADTILSDTVQNFGGKSESGNGFYIEDFSMEAIAKVVKRVVTAFQDNRKWQRIMRNAMKKDSSWQAVAENYTQRYARLLVDKK